ncbi:MAG: hypothetical protein PUC65_16335 [Clostridiales bacterium]|nr:hypothetical protein [Clostridiales bacterium]
MKALFLYGIYGTSELWNQLIPKLSTWKCEILSYANGGKSRAVSSDIS